MMTSTVCLHSLCMCHTYMVSTSANRSGQGYMRMYINIYYTSDRLYKCNRLRPGSKAPLNAVHAECLKFMPIQGAIEKVFDSVLCHFCEGTTSA